MKKEALKKRTGAELRKKAQGIKTLTGIFIPLILGLSYFGLRGYASGEGAGLPVLIIAICSLGGLLSLLPELRAIREEQRAREL